MTSAEIHERVEAIRAMTIGADAVTAERQLWLDVLSEIAAGGVSFPVQVAAEAIRTNPITHWSMYHVSTSEQKSYTEVEVRERERAAYIAGAAYEANDNWYTMRVPAITKEAAKRYPDPTARVSVGDHDYRLHHGELQIRYKNGEWYGDWHRSIVQPADVRELTKLIAGATSATAAL